MSSDVSYRVATPHVIHETVDGEVILIHLERGTYHSLRGSGALLFEPLLRGASARELEAVLAAETDADAATVEGAVERVVQALWRQALVVLADGAPGTTAAPATAPGPALARRPFEEPCLETFTDLQDLLTADPIHEVEPLGWPRVSRDTQTR
jgi:hypothetical protein